MIPRHQHAHRPRDLRRATRTRDDHTVLPQRRIGEPWVGAVCASLRHGTRCMSSRTRVERIGGSIRHGRRQAGRSPEVAGLEPEAWGPSHRSGANQGSPNASDALPHLSGGGPVPL
ncbi:hypothetical protein AK37_14181 [Rhodococcus pyridinivorans AK37]|uniref:Uncharacterized protein n=1 Tax=Rhodococcus pyridinivorans AK37 TaxID=1114960 RepID=H0JT25_9NOCA|nr:hypothetical protein AK37_14181 [Rhodococcus pyridinivorans AK37]